MSLRTERSLRLERLPGLGRNLVVALAECGCREDTIHACLGGLRIQCATCGLGFSAGELMEAFAHHSETGETNPKWQRLLRGYCARNGCDSYFYNVQFPAGLDVNWDSIWETMEALDTAATEVREELSEVEREPSSPRRWLRRPLIALVGAGLFGVIVLHWGFGWRIPGFSPKPRVFIVH